MIRHTTSDPAVPRGKTISPSSKPSAISNTGAIGATSCSKNSTSTSSLTRSSAKIVSPSCSLTTFAISLKAARSQPSTTTSRIFSCNLRTGPSSSRMSFMFVCSERWIARAAPLLSHPVTYRWGRCPRRFPVRRETSTGLACAAVDETQCENENHCDRRRPWAPGAVAWRMEKAFATDCRTSRACLSTRSQSRASRFRRALRDSGALF